MKPYQLMFYLTFTTSIFNCAIFLCCYKNIYSQTLVDIAFILNIFLLHKMYDYKQENDYVESLFKKVGVKNENDNK